MGSEETREIDDRFRVVFRQVDAPGWEPGMHWQAELHDLKATDFGSTFYPIALAWITAYPVDSPVGGPALDFVLVPDQCRRQGYARALARACEDRFPGLWLTDPISEAGEGLCDALERDTGPAI